MTGLSLKGRPRPGLSTGIPRNRQGLSHKIQQNQ